MRLITHNPYRVIGILANASEKEILKQKNKLIAYSKANKPILLELDFTNLSVISRTADEITQAFSKIERAEDRLFYSFFWFVNELPIDNIAIDHLKLGNIDKAYEVWRKATENKQLTDKNTSVFNNISTLLFLMKSDKEALVYKLKLIESLSFKQFTEFSTDEKFSINPQVMIERILIAYFNLFDEYVKHNKMQALLKMLDANSYARKFLIEMLSEKENHKLEKLLEEMEETKQNPDSLSMSLLNEYVFKIKVILKNLLNIYSEDDLNIAISSDKCAEILRGSINVFFNHYGDSFSKKQIESCKDLMVIARNYATNVKTIDMIENDINNYQEQIEAFEFKEIIAKIENFKQKPQTSDSALVFAKECVIPVKNLANNDEIYLNMSSIIVKLCLEVSIEQVNKAQSDKVSIHNLRNIVFSSVCLLNYLNKDYTMDYQTKQHLSKNLNTIEDMNRKLNAAIASSNNRAVNNNASSNDDSEGCLGIVFWIGLLILFLIFIFG